MLCRWTFESKLIRSLRKLLHVLESIVTSTDANPDFDVKKYIMNNNLVIKARHLHAPNMKRESKYLGITCKLSEYNKILDSQKTISMRNLSFIVGIVLCEIYGKTPFNIDNDLSKMMILMRQIYEDEEKMCDNYKITENIPEDIRKLIERCWNPIPLRRLSVKGIVKELIKIIST